MNPAVLSIDCPEHGRGKTAAVCGHVVANRKLSLGFVENSSDPDDLQGWCFACEHMFLAEGGKTARFQAFCHHSIVCVDCYEAIKQFHQFRSDAADA